MPSRRRMLALASAVLLGGACLGAEPAPPAFKVATSKDADEVKVSADKERTCFDVVSKTGIGGAKIQRTGKTWPEKMRLRLHLAGLENFHIACGGRGLSAAILSHGEDRAAGLTVSDGTTEKRVAAGDPLWMEIRMIDKNGEPTKRIPLDGFFEMDLPTALFEKNPESIELGWIDFYRR